MIIYLIITCCHFLKIMTSNSRRFCFIYRYMQSSFFKNDVICCCLKCVTLQFSFPKTTTYVAFYIIILLIVPNPFRLLLRILSTIPGCKETKNRQYMSLDETDKAICKKVKQQEFTPTTKPFVSRRSVHTYYLLYFFCGYPFCQDQ